MPKKLKNLRIIKVDFVEEGANPDANIVLAKRKSGLPAADSNHTANSKDIAKSGAETFSATLDSRYTGKLTEEAYILCSALSDSLCSVLWDEELDAEQKHAAMRESLDEFTAVMTETFPVWMTGKPVGYVIKTAKAGTNQPKGETNMKIDKSKLTPEEAAALDAIEKKAGIPDEPSAGGTAQSDGQESASVQKTAPDVPVANTAPVSAASAAKTESVPDDSAGEDIYKGLPAALRQEIETLRKFRQDTEDAKLREIAGNYAIVGKTADQLFPVFKRLKAASPEAYEQMISTLNDAKAAVEKSGAFGEIGRTGNGSMTRGGAVREVETKAVELRKR